MKAKLFFPTKILISILLSQLTFAAYPRYEIIDLGTYNGGWSVPCSINNNGQVVGWAEADSVLHATLFDTTGSGNNIDLGTLGGDGSCALYINDNGWIVGFAQDNSRARRATLFDPMGTCNNTDLGTLGGGESVAWSINNIGQILGFAENTAGDERATLFDSTGNGNNIDLGTLGGYMSFGRSINNTGQIVGWAENTFGNLHATLFDASGNANNIDLCTLGGDGSSALSINENGLIVGTAGTNSSYLHATLFDQTGKGNNIDLGTLGGVFSAAHSINESGQIVGDATDSSDEMHATLFDPTGNGNNINLNTLVKPDSDWHLANASSINNHGWIVGAGDNPNGEYHAYLLIPIPPKIIYVDEDAAGANDGSSWADAFNYLQDALAAAWGGDEIHVAEGIYTPDSNSAYPNGSGDREATFQLINGVTLKGGYAGAGTPDPNACDIELYETILSGDLNGNDVDVNDPIDLLDDQCRAENSYHVVTGSGTDETAVINGFTITAGNANNSDLYSPHQLGGGIYNYESNPTVIDCTISGNSAAVGGGIYNMHSGPTLRNCSFIGNSAYKVLYNGGSGGGMYTRSYSGESHPEVVNCVFEGNSAISGGGISSGGQLVVTDCIFNKNRGGGIRGTATELKGCAFTSNQGGGIFIGSDSHLSNCLFAGNIGGGLQAQDCDIVVTNCSFIGNITSVFFVGIWNDEGDTTVANCISWGNIGEDGMTESAQIATHDPAVINYCCIQGWTGTLGGTGNFGVDPCFVSQGYWDVLPDFNEDYWYRHIHWTDGDYHLLPGSPCIDAGDPNYIAGPNETDLDGKPRVIGGRIDMGTYETPIFAETRILPRTINLASRGKWITCYIWLPEGYNVADIDPNSVSLSPCLRSGVIPANAGIQTQHLRIEGKQQVAIAKFSREDVQPILEVGDIELTITGKLTDGTVFEATDTIKVLNKAGKN